MTPDFYITSCWANRLLRGVLVNFENAFAHRQSENYWEWAILKMANLEGVGIKI